MAQDIRDLFKEENLKHEEMPKNHEARFLNKLENAFPEETQKPSRFSWLNIAASVVLLIGLSFGAYKFMGINKGGEEQTIQLAETENSGLGKVSPELKKVEDYYLASINLELSKIKPTTETKAVFDGYLEQLEELNQEYKRLSLELNENTSELTINALIDNLRFRLDLLYRLKEQLQTLNTSDESTEVKQST
ncbi:hypothetical protein [Hyunsoonleella pacifica]|uniref:Anti-sigma factor n=1 Tax=Hyunsoonleella pacifica TaxID=1080224 RepID=A0A4Q9FK61_9FLAO|nr:hypothetical protein [Hyunsoonleella pacifica]TBN13802.1 hypothetical protein EYD46_15010 [Hyunsoonleella pacifica]GGD25799.1 hypothetical protein GCM10011368_29780 [Hyunsoonleella pacifica]